MKGKIFNAQEVLAIMRADKTMFREVIKPQPEEKLKGYFYSLGETTGYCESLFILDKCPYQVGQKIFVKESFNIFAGQVTYTQNLANWKPAKHMKQEHSRIILQIKEIRVERLKDISEFEAFKKEGMPSGTPIYWFAEEWDSTHKKPEEKFEANPWVWVINFEVI